MTFQVLADFDRDNSFAYDLTDYTQDVRFFNGMRDIYQSVGDDTTIEVTLVNSDGRFNPEDSTGAYYGKYILNSRVKVTSGTIVMGIGYVTNIDPDHQALGAATGNSTALLTCEGARDRLSRMTVDLSIYQDVTGDVIINDILEVASIVPATGAVWLAGITGASEAGVTTYAVGASAYSDVETGLTTFAHFGDDSTTSNAWQAITEVTEGERGRFFQARDGRMTWWNRHHLLTTVTDGGTVTMGGTYRPVDVDYEYRLSNVYNVVRVEVQPRNLMSASGTLWYTNEDINIPAGGTIIFDGLLRDGDGRFVGADTVTLNPVFSAGTATMSYQMYGARCEITGVNSGSSAAVMDSISVTGIGYQNRNALVYKAEDGTSIAYYGKRQIEFTIPALATYDSALSIAEFELLRRKNPSGIIRSMVFKAQDDGTRNAHLLDWTIGDRIAITLNNGHAADHFIIGEEHTVKFSKIPIHECRYFFEPTLVNDFWLAGIAGYGESGTTTYAGY